MDSYELVARTLRFEKPERVPLLFRSTPSRSDMVVANYTTPAGWTATEPDADEWGCVWSNIIGTGVGQVTKHPLENTTDLRSYRFPDPLAPGRFDGVKEFVRSNAGKYIAGNVGLSGFNLMMSLRGFENLLMDTAAPSKFLAELMDRVWTYEASIIEQYARLGGPRALVLR